MLQGAALTNGSSAQSHVSLAHPIATRGHRVLHHPLTFDLVHLVVLVVYVSTEDEVWSQMLQYGAPGVCGCVMCVCVCGWVCVVHL